MATRAKITASRTASGVVIRMGGAGTIGESPVVHAFAEEVLRDPGQRVIVDLTACTYMDSTFLGGLIGLFKRHGADGRFALHAPEPLRKELFGASRLDTVLPFVDEVPPSHGESQLEAQPMASREELAHYVVECHRRLAEMGGPEAVEFSRVADAIAAEIESKR